MIRLRSILYQLNQAVVDSKFFLSAHGKSGGRLFRVDSLSGFNKGKETQAGLKNRNSNVTLTKTLTYQFSRAFAVYALFTIPEKITHYS